MRFKQHRATSFPGAILVALVVGCGVEVGNPSEPTPAQPKRSEQVNIPGVPPVPIETLDPAEPVEPVRIDVRYLVENQYDEAITAALDFAFDNTTVALALAGNDTRTCGVQSDGSLVLSHQETNSETRSSGTAADATQVTESFSRVFSSRMQSAGKTLACNTGLTKPKLDWSKLQNVSIDGSLDRSNSRTIVMAPSLEFVRESSAKAIGSHQSMVRKVKFDPNSGLQLSRALSFGTDMEISNKTKETALTSLKTHIETQVSSPLAIEESYNAESKLKSVKISSGAVSSLKQDDGLTVVMRYDDVVLDAEGTCLPTSGEIQGEIFLPGDMVNVYERFGIAFTSKGSLIVYGDGSSSKLEFEPCRIEIDAPAPSNNNNNNGPPPGRGGR